MESLGPPGLDHGSQGIHYVILDAPCPSYLVTVTAKRLTLEYEASVVEKEAPLTNTFNSDFLTSLDPSIAASLYSDFDPLNPF